MGTKTKILIRPLSWQKLGLVIKPQKHLWWMQTHAMLPTVDKIGADQVKVYFSGRDRDNRSHIGYSVFNLKNFSVEEYSAQPVLTLGELGCFDDNGVTPSWIINCGKKKFLYYIGWNQKSRVRMSLIAGLAVSKDGGKTFMRVSRGPLLERTDTEPFSILTAPCIIAEKELWKMWYVSGIGWDNPDLPRYNIKYAESIDGIHWKREGKVCIGLRPDEHALARPCVLQENGIYKMWFSYKGKDYRIGYAESSDGLTWVRKDKNSGIDVSQSGWDSQMIEYSYVLNHKGKKYMFYNGNNYGFDGIGLAVLVEGNKR